MTLTILMWILITLLFPAALAAIAGFILTIVFYGLGVSCLTDSYKRLVNMDYAKYKMIRVYDINTDDETDDDFSFCGTDRSNFLIINNFFVLPDKITSEYLSKLDKRFKYNFQDIKVEKSRDFIILSEGEGCPTYVVVYIDELDPHQLT